MRNKLQKFSDFAGTLLPHETEFLMSGQQFEDEVKLAILRQVNENSHRLTGHTPYDTAIDKRKYSHLKNWIEERLQAVDVDEEFEWMCRLEQRIMTDSIDALEEKTLLKKIRDFEPPVFYFTKFYELVETYRHFLLIRLRYDDHLLVDEFLKKQRTRYQRSKEISETIHTATADIIDQYATNTADSRKWEQWLTDIFLNEDVDGLNRYLALIRLAFLYLNYRQLDKLSDKYAYLSDLFRRGRSYSKRLLLNYYHNLSLMYTKGRDYEQAIYYGYLSIRQKNNDYLLYVNHLSAVLLRRGRWEEALELLRQALGDMKESKNFFNKIGFVAFYVHALNNAGKPRNAENYAEAFLQAYRQEVFKYRWHLFFSAYLQALLRQEKYTKVLRTVRKYKLMDRDKRYQKRAGYLPTIPFYLALAEHQEGLLTRRQLQQRLLTYLPADTAGREEQSQSVRELLNELRRYVPEVVRGVEESMEGKGDVAAVG